jgi:hypothetical protein
VSEVIALPLRCPVFGNLANVVSLRAVLEFNADHFCQSMSLIGQFHQQIRSGEMPTQDSLKVIAGELGLLQRHCTALGLNTTIAQIERVKEMLFGEYRASSWAMVAGAVLEVGTRLTDELEARKMYLVKFERNSYLTGNHFDASVGERFPDAIPDMDEAARCFAFERATACIFHLMRVTEHGLKAIADLLEIHDHAPTWEPVIRKIDAELKADYKNRKYKGDQDFLANASTHLHAVKVAWRNKTMHIEKIDTMEQAERVYYATCGFMDYLARNLPKSKGGIVRSIRSTLGV